MKIKASLAVYTVIRWLAVTELTGHSKEVQCYKHVTCNKTEIKCSWKKSETLHSKAFLTFVITDTSWKKMFTLRCKNYNFTKPAVKSIKINAYGNTVTWIYVAEK